LSLEVRRISNLRGVVVFVLLVLALGVAAGRTARAEGHALSAEQREREKKALAAYAAARFEDAVNLYAELYAEYRDPIYLRNVGRCYQKMKKPEQAIASFEDYLARATKLTDAERAEVNGYIAEMRALQAAGSVPAPQDGAVPPGAPPAGPAMRAPAPVTPVPGAYETAPAPAPSMPSAAPAAPAAGTADLTAAIPPPAQSWSTKKKAGLALGIAGGASLVTGVIFHLVRNSRAQDFNDAGCYASGSGPAPGYASCQGSYDNVQSAQTIAIVGYVGAALLGGVGTYLFFSDHTETAGGTRTASNRDRAFGCAPSPDLSLVCAGSF
jgi:hypothetical protein